MSFNFDITQATNILKQYYTKMKIETLTFESAALAIVPKDTGGAGNSYVGAIRSAIPSSVSADDTVAFTSGSASTYNQWVCPWRFGYGSANVTGEVIDKTSNDAGAFVRALTSETEGAFKAIGQHVGSALWGNGGGSIGQISATSDVTTTTITLANPAQIVNFWQGQILQAATTDGTTGSVETGTVTVQRVNINTGQIVATAAWNGGIGTIAAGDFLFMKGDFGAKVQGFPAWIPSTRPVSSTDSFNSVNRSFDEARLAGAFFDGGGGPKAESMIQLGMLVQRLGGRPTHFFVNPVDYAEIVKERFTDIRYVTETAFKNAQIGFPAVSLATPFGQITILQDVFVPSGFGWLLDMKTWLLISMGQLPKVDLADGLNWLRNAGADSYQFRTLYRAATYCSNPGHNGCTKF